MLVPRALAVLHVTITLLLMLVVLAFAVVLAPLLLLGPIWGLVVGVRLWRQGAAAFAALRRVHWVYLAVDGLLVAYGIFALKAAEQSAARGGGLLGGIGIIPLGLGIVMACLSLIILAVARATRVLIPCLLVLAVCGASVTAQSVAAQNGIVQQWAGRVARPLALEAPIKGFITTQAELARLWQVWQIQGEVPTVDFTKYFFLVATSRSSVFKVRAVQVDEKGDLKTVVVATPDFARDYAIVITQVERAGVKTVHGQTVE